MCLQGAWSFLATGAEASRDQKARPTILRADGAPDTTRTCDLCLWRAAVLCRQSWNDVFNQSQESGLRAPATIASCEPRSQVQTLSLAGKGCCVPPRPIAHKLARRTMDASWGCVNAALVCSVGLPTATAIRAMIDDEEGLPPAQLIDGALRSCERVGCAVIGGLRPSRSGDFCGRPGWLDKSERPRTKIERFPRGGKPPSGAFLMSFCDPERPEGRCE